MSEATLAPDDVIEVRFTCYAPGQQGINVLYYHVVSVSGASMSLASALSIISSRASTRYRALLAEQCKYLGVNGRLVLPTKSLTLQSSTGSGIGDIVDTGLMSKQAALVVTKQSDQPGPGARGRMYIPFPTNGAGDDNGDPTDGYVADVTSLCTDMLLPFAVGVAPDVVQVRPVLLKPAVPGWIPITSFRVNDKFGTQKRRSDYGKANPAIL